jgi:hypothetical protein
MPRSHPNGDATRLIGDRFKLTDSIRRPHSEPPPEPVVAAGHIIEALVRIDDWVRILRIDRRTFERMRAGGRIPPPDLVLGPKSPRWLASTLERFLATGGRHG